jgi:hypothetical protein
VNLRRSATALAPVLVGVLALTACTGGNPSARRVAEDIIESVDGLTDEQRACMLARLEDYTDEQLDVINEQNQNVDFSVENPDVSEDYQAFQDDLAECRETTAAQPSGSSEPSASTETAGSTEPPGSTEPAGSPEAEAAPSSTGD